MRAYRYGWDDNVVSLGRTRIAPLRATATTRIACAPERVFDVLADLRREPEWNSRVTDAELVSGEPIGLGSRFSIVNGGSSFEVTLAEYERPTRLVFEAKGKPDLTITYTFASDEKGTKLESALDFRPTGALKAVFAVLGPVIRRNVPKQYASLKTLCES
jgi:uncharacterized protein YndB with AHSA1/START domain